MRRVILMSALFGAVILGIGAYARSLSADHKRPDSPWGDLSTDRQVDNLLARSPQSSSPPPSPAPVNVLLISIDTLRADHMSLYGYHRRTTPRIDEFAQRGRVFERAYSTAPLTSPSVVSMLTGLYPPQHRVRLLWQKLPAETATIAEQLKSAGYQTAAVVSNIVLSHRASGLGSGFDHFDDHVDEPERHRPHMLERCAARTTDSARQWLREHRQPGSPFFLWVHYMDPHAPYGAPSDAAVRFAHADALPVDVERIPAWVREPEVTDGREYIDRYDEEIAYTDVHVGRLLDELEALNLLAGTSILVTADHGEYLLDGPQCHFCHGYDVADAVIHVPLIIVTPHVAAERMTQPVSIADIAPTILELAGLPVPDMLDGRSLLAAISPRPPYAEGSDQGGSGGLHRTFIGARRKVVVQHGLSNVPRRAWAFDLEADPHEGDVLPVDRAEPAYQMLSAIIHADPDPGGKPEHLVRGDQPSPLVSGEVDGDACTALRSLGYVE